MSLDPRYSSRSSAACPGSGACLERVLPTILFYEIPANCFGFAPNFFFILSEEDIKAKLDALNQYQSQIQRSPDFFSIEKFRAVLTHTGMLVGEQYAEGFVMHSSTVR